jgi:hypothetical protein
VSNEEIFEHYGWKSHKFGFFDEWREEVSRRIELTPHPTHNTSRLRANYSKEVFDEIFLKKEKNDEN